MNTPKPPNASNKHIPELDALRGLAALVVVVYHLRSHKIVFGWAAVDLFFVLSGFLITTIILSNTLGGQFFKGFYARRSLRIWPIYYLSLLAFALINPFLPRPYAISDALPYYLTYTQNVHYYWSDTGPFLRPFGHTWTLAIEEQFYLIWPLLIFLVGRRFVIPLTVIVTLAATAALAAG